MPYLDVKQEGQDSATQVPYLHDRDTLGHWGRKQIDAGTIDAYRAKNNSYSLDGLPGLRRARRDGGDLTWISEIKEIIKQKTFYWQMAFVAILSAVLTVLCLFMLGLTTIEAPSQRRYQQLILQPWGSL